MSDISDDDAPPAPRDARRKANGIKPVNATANFTVKPVADLDADAYADATPAKGKGEKAAGDAKKKPRKKKATQMQMPETAEEKKYHRDRVALPIKEIQDKKLKGNLRKTIKKFDEAAKKAAQVELLLPEEAGYLEAEGMEKTYHVRQADLREAVDMNTRKKIFDLKSKDFGPYSLDYTRNGKFLLLAGRKGHISTMDWASRELGCEFH
ncbi:Small subunit (SSU) processome component, partial [Irineochytrium annulatum]